MTNFKFMVHGTIRASNEAFARSDVSQALNAKPHIVVLDHSVIVLSERAECVGSGRPATHATIATTSDKPYNMGTCAACGVMIPLLSQGEFEVISHVAANVLEAPK